MHYERQRSTGNLGPSVKFKDSYGVCVVLECSTQAGPTGACRKHWHKINSPLKSRKRVLKAKGLTLEKYQELLKKQDNKCKICGTTTPGGSRINFAIDHDHKCCPDYFNHCGNCFRGLLCTRCNTTLGAVEDNIGLLTKMIDYLKAPTPLDRSILD